MGSLTLLNYNYILHNKGQYNSYRSLLPTLSDSDSHYYTLLSDYVYLNINNANELNICRYEENGEPSDNVVEVTIPHTNNTNNGVYFGILSNPLTGKNEGREIV